MTLHSYSTAAQELVRRSATGRCVTIMPSANDTSISSRLRGHVPAVQFGQLRGWKLFDSPSGTQMIDGCLDGIQSYLSTGVSNRRQVGPIGDATEALLERARREVKQLLNAEGYTVVFGQNMTSLAFALGHGLARKHARPGSTILGTELEHSANVDSWKEPFAERGSVMRLIPIDEESLRLDERHTEEAFATPNIVLVALTLASNAIGTVIDGPRLTSLAHDAGALVAVDGVQAVPHHTIDLTAWQPDIFLWSAYKCYGPHLGIALIRDELAEALAPYKVAPALDASPDKFETGTQSHEAIAGLLGTFDALGRLVGSSGGAGARQALAALASPQREIANFIEDELRKIAKVTVFRPSEAAGPRTPTIAFRVEGRSPAECAARLRDEDIFITHSDFYATALADRLRVRATGGWARIGVAGYTTAGEAEQLVEAVRSL